MIDVYEDLTSMFIFVWKFSTEKIYNAYKISSKHIN